MLDRGEPLGSDQLQAAPDGAPPESGRPATERGSGTLGVVALMLFRVQRTFVQARAVVGLVLVAAGLVWGIARGLAFYGVSPVHLAYDLDQPPWLLVLVSAWLLYRNRRK
jgi:hypothetical protein